MNGKLQKIYHALIDGAQAGLADEKLFRHVLEKCPKATSKKIVRASLLALSDPDVKDKSILDVIYALAIKHRLDPLTKDDLEEVKDKPEPKRAKKAAEKRKRDESEKNDARYSNDDGCSFAGAQR